MNIVVSNVKGGVGKTTTAVYLAGAAAERGRDAVYLVDADRQASSAEWFETMPIPGRRAGRGAFGAHGGQGHGTGGRHRRGRHPAGRRAHRAGRPGPGRCPGHPHPGRRGGAEPGGGHARDDPVNIPAGVVICSARLGTRDLEATIEWWAELEVPVWGIIPERVSIASGPAARLSSEGLELYGQVLRKATGQAPLSGQGERDALHQGAAGLAVGPRRRRRAPCSWAINSDRNQRRTATLAGEAGRVSSWATRTNSSASSSMAS